MFTMYLLLVRHQCKDVGRAKICKYNLSPSVKSLQSLHGVVKNKYINKDAASH